jgi:hypothetical protein
MCSDAEQQETQASTAAGFLNTWLHPWSARLVINEQTEPRCIDKPFGPGVDLLMERILTLKILASRLGRVCCWTSRSSRYVRDGREVS